METKMLSEQEKASLEEADKEFYQNGHQPVDKSVKARRNRIMEGFKDHGNAKLKEKIADAIIAREDYELLMQETKDNFNQSVQILLLKISNLTHRMKRKEADLYPRLHKFMLKEKQWEKDMQQANLMFDQQAEYARSEIAKRDQIILEQKSLLEYKLAKIEEVLNTVAQKDYQIATITQDAMQARNELKHNIVVFHEAEKILLKNQERDRKFIATIEGLLKCSIFSLRKNIQSAFDLYYEILGYGKSA